MEQPQAAETVAAVPDVPQQAPDEPQQAPDVPQQAPDEPQQAPDVPQQAPDEPQQPCPTNKQQSVYISMRWSGPYGVGGLGVVEVVC
jgi:nucleoid-associated protein YgaU